MKKTLLILCLLTIMMFGCGYEQEVFEIHSSGASSYDQSNIYFVQDHSSIHYMNLKTGETGYLCYDPLCLHQIGECQACINNGKEFMGGLTVIKENCIYYVKNFINDKGENEGFGIVEYDATSQRSKALLKNVPDLITQFVVKGNDIYYFMNSYSENGNGIRNIYKYSLINKKTKLLTDGIERNLLFFHSEGEDVYLEDLDLGILYKTDWSFREMKEIKVFKSSYSYFYLYNGYLYYFEESGKIEELKWPRIINDVESLDEEPFYYEDVFVDLLRVPLENINAEPQIVAEHVVSSANLKFYDNHIVCSCKKPDYYKTEQFETVDIKSGEPIISLRDVYSECGDLVSINLITLDKEVILKSGIFDVYNVYYWDENMLVFYGKNIEEEKSQKTTQSIMATVKIDLQTRELSILWNQSMK